jgi:hypothetical protein
MEGLRVCQCIACKGVAKLSLKFIVHYGTISENQIASFMKASGIDMVIAHRLLKNKIERDEYVLITKKFLNQTPDRMDQLEMEWVTLKESYSSIGDVEFDVATLDKYREELLDAQKDCSSKLGQKIFEQDLEIQSNSSDVFNLLIDLPERQHYVPGIHAIQFRIPTAAIGMPQAWKFKQDAMEVIPIGLDVRNSKILYFEEVRHMETEDRVILEFRVDEREKNNTNLGISLYQLPEMRISRESELRFTTIFAQMLNLIKARAEQGYIA